MYDEFALLEREASRTPAGMREGQHAFNVVQASRPDIARAAIKAGLDPFYDDAKLPEFWDFVAEMF